MVLTVKKERILVKRKFIVVILYYICYSACCYAMSNDEEDDYVASMTCQYCSSLGLIPGQLYKQELIETFTKPAVAVKHGQLIMVPAGDKQWTYAIVNYDHTAGDRYISVHKCHGHIQSFFSITCLKALKLAYQWQWQPKPPIEYMFLTLVSYAQQHVQENPRPSIQAQVLPSSSIIILIGDLHGSIDSLMHHLQRFLLKGIIDAEGVLNQQYYLVFLGDYSDRGCYSAEVWHRLMELKLANPEHVFLVRGNHESLELAQEYGFFKEYQSKLAFQIDTEENQKKLFNLMCQSLPQVVLLGAPHTPDTSIIEQYKFLMCCHGGIEPTVSLNMPIIKAIAHYKKTGTSHPITHFFDHPKPSLTGFLWSDFHANSTEDENPCSKKSERGAGLKTYNSSALCEYLERFYSEHPQHPYCINALFRGHQHLPGGISCLLTHSNTGNAGWANVMHHQTIIIDQPSVFTLNSSPEGLAIYGCHEDACARVTCSQTGLWQLMPHIKKRDTFH